MDERGRGNNNYSSGRASDCPSASDAPGTIERRKTRKRTRSRQEGHCTRKDRRRPRTGDVNETCTENMTDVNNVSPEEAPEEKLTKKVSGCIFQR